MRKRRYRRYCRSANEFEDEVVKSAMVTSGVSVGDIPEWSRIAIDNGRDTRGGLQECRRIGDTRFWTQMVSSECMVLQNQVDVELPGVGVGYTSKRLLSYIANQLSVLK